MDFDVALDQNANKIKNKLNQDKIKLWLPPYYSEKNGENEDEIEKLALNYSTQLSIQIERCKGCLQKLQSTALENLRDRDKYQSTGVATIKVRVPKGFVGGHLITVNIELSNTGIALQETISKEISVPIDRLKVVFKGKILKEQDSLESQGVKHGLQVMAIILQESNDVCSTSESHAKLLNSTKADVKLLSNSKNSDYLQVADQSGKALELPEEEKKSLILAMTLHEKGRAALKKEDYPLALVMLLEAEREFSRCKSSLLKSVDNYGLLSLDIAWCYLNLESVTQLPNAEERLHQCELSFHQSYGQNLERLIALKGSAGNESVLFMRLHLLQAIIYYHQSRLDEAGQLFKQVEQELQHLIVDDSLLSHMIELGYNAAEARLALRESNGDVNTAVAIIENKKIERKKISEAEEREKKIKEEKRKLGKCLNGSWIEPQFHKALMSMGYSHETARWALAQSNNSIYTSVNLIQEHPELMPAKKKSRLSQEAIDQVVAVGFEIGMAKRALKRSNGDVNKAVEELVIAGGFLSGESDSNSDSEDSQAGPSSSNNSKEMQEAYSRVAEGLMNTEENHLDFNLVAETAFLNKYKELMSNR